MNINFYVFRIFILQDIWKISVAQLISGSNEIIIFFRKWEILEYSYVHYLPIIYTKTNLINLIKDIPVKIPYFKYLYHDLISPNKNLYSWYKQIMVTTTNNYLVKQIILTEIRIFYEIQ